MTREESKSCIGTIELLRRLAYNIHGVMDVIDADNCEKIIKALEQEPNTGHWILTIEDWNKWKCSECGFSKRTDIHVKLGYNYCPNCGARMESEGI